MDVRERGRSESSTSTAGATAASAPAPGRQTLAQPEEAAQVQRAESRGGAGDQDPAEVRRTAAAGLAGGARALPHLDKIQRSFGAGHDVSGIQAHVGGPAAAASGAIGASAYATGNSVAFAGEPDLHTAAHEAAHVVQQREGVSLKGGVGEAGDAHEQHADAVADRVVAGQSAADLLGPASGKTATAGGAVQRDVPPARYLAESGQVKKALQAAIDAGQWEVIRARVYPREAAATKQRADQRRAGALPDLKGEGSTVSLDAIAAAFKAIQTAWGAKTPAERGQAMVDAANAALVAAGVPKYLDSQVMAMTPRGAFSSQEWKFFIREASVTPATVTSDEMGELAGTTAHESRHAEQHFLNARFLAGQGKTAKEVEAAAEVPSAIAVAAVAKKLASNDPRFGEAQTMNQAFGADGAKNHAIDADVDTQISDLNNKRGVAIVAKAALDASVTQQTVDTAKAATKALTDQTLAVEKAYLAYRAIPYEADAHEVGDSESRAFSKLP